MKNLRKQSKKGFSLIELLLVLGIIAALAIAAFMIYPKVSSSNNAQTEASNINTIKASVASLYASSPDYTGLTNSVALAAKLYPDTMINSAGTNALNTFKGAVTLGTSAQSPSAVANSAFTITYAAVPPAECVKIVSAVASNFYRVRVGTTDVKVPAVAGSSNASNINVATLSTACNAGNTTIIFTSL